MYAYLADNVPVGETDNHPVLGCVVLVLILYNQALTSKEVSLSLWKEHTLISLKMTLKITDTRRKTTRTGCLTSPPPEFDLVPLEVGLVLHHFNKTLQKKQTGTDLRIKGETFDIAKTSSTLLYCVSSWTVSVTG